jgi:hypothetical protein
MRYQVVVLDEEVGIDIDIDHLGWQVHPASYPSAEFSGLRIYMGYCDSDQLGSVFEDNYIPGSKVLVYERASQVCAGSPDEWFTLELDTPYGYVQSEGNLIIEVQWETPVDYHSFYTWAWNTGTIRAVANTSAGAPSSTSGSLSSAVSRFMLSGQGMTLEQSTFCGIKVLGDPR